MVCYWLLFDVYVKRLYTHFYIDSFSLCIGCHHNKKTPLLLHSTSDQYPCCQSYRPSNHLWGHPYQRTNLCVKSATSSHHLPFLIVSHPPPPSLWLSFGNADLYYVVSNGSSHLSRGSGTCLPAAAVGAAGQNVLTLADCWAPTRMHNIM